ncbi:hypothetical protein ES702_02722 [subsurface metagenome]
MLDKALSSLLLVSTLVFIVLVTALPVNNPDIWYHLKTGEYIVQEKTIPKKDFYSFTAAGREWIAQWWFYDVIVFFLQNRFGFNSLIYLKVAIGILIFFVLYKTLRFYQLPDAFILILLVFSAWIVGTAWVDRPHIFSYLFTVLLMWVLISYQFGKKRPLFLIPPLFLIWANMHASIPIALALVGFLIISEVWKNISTGKPLLVTGYWLLVTLLAGTITSLVNPNTYKTHLYVFKINPEFVSKNIVEWIPLSSFFADLHIRLFLFFGLLTLVSFFHTLLRPPKKKILRLSLFEILLIASLSYLSLSALRFTPVFVLIILPFMAKNLWYMTCSMWEGACGKWSGLKQHAIRYALRAKIGILFAILALCFFHEQRFKSSHLGVEVGLLPVEAAEFIDRVQPAPPMYHVFNWGGYLMWRLYPKYKVFIDGRLDMYVPDVYDEWLSVVLARENWKEIFEKYEINFCLISQEPEWNKLGQTLESDSDWVLIYWDNQSGIFIKNDPKNQELLEEYGMDSVTIYHLTTPFKPGREKEAEKEYLKFLELYSKSAPAHNKLGVLYFLTDRKEKAEEELQKAIELNPSYATAYFNLGLIIEEKGDYNGALGFYQKAKEYAPGFPDIYKKLGYIYSQKLNYQEEAVWHLKKYLNLNPNAPDRREVELEIQKNI